MYIFRDFTLGLRHLGGLVLCAILLPAAIPLSAYFTWLPNGRKIASEHADIIQQLPCADPGQIPLFFASQVVRQYPLCEELNGTLQTSWRIALPLLFAMLDVAAAYSLVSFCAFKIWTQVRRELIKPDSASVQRQLNYALAVQVRTGLRFGAFQKDFCLRLWHHSG